MTIWQKLCRSHAEAIRDVEIKDLRILGNRTISALESIDILTVGDLLDLPSLSPYETFFPRDIYENIKVLRRIVLRTSGKKHFIL